MGSFGAAAAYSFYPTKNLAALERFCALRDSIHGVGKAFVSYKREAYGIGLRKEDEARREQFNRAIAEVQANGTYDQIRAKYFSFDIK